MDTALTYERNGLDVSIYYDTDPQSPREWDNLGTMICSHKRYTLGDEQFDPDEYDGWEDLKKHLFAERDAGWILPLRLSDHSGLTMRIGDDSDWDSGQVGFIFVTQKKLEEEYGTIGDLEIEKAIAVLEAEVKVYSQYLEGDVYGIKVTNPADGEVIESCWGYFGIEEAQEEANILADSFVHPNQAKYAKKASELHG